ncbi:hypothetical protein BJ742DRAFT_809623 [Cladochytrium replicatum]|nr:hypothetical protein BJ742DRAFT_809623 [Cladochytrium replicatum]
MVILLLGSTGRVGSRTLSTLLAGGHVVRVILRSPSRLTDEQRAYAKLSIICGSVTDPEFLKANLDSVTAVISCLGHGFTFRNVVFDDHFVFSSAKAVISAIDALRPQAPIKFIQLNNVGVNHPSEDIRSGIEKALLSAIHCAVVPVEDSQKAFDFISSTDSPFIEWVVVRPDHFIEGDAAEYVIREKIEVGILAQRDIHMSSIAHFMCRLIADNNLWEEWKGRSPVLYDKHQKGGIVLP